MERKLKMGCLHGCGTNAKFMKRQMRSFIQVFEDKFEFIFLEAPFKAPKQVVDDSLLKMLEGEPKIWKSLKSFHYEHEEYAKEVSTKIKQTLENGSDHYDAFIGFSQGGALLYWLLKMLEIKRISIKGIDKIELAIFVCTNHWTWPTFSFTEPLTLPSIHFMSEYDFLFHNSLLMTSQFSNPLMLFHNFGHAFPQVGKGDRQKILEYMKEHENKKVVSLKNSRL